MKVFDAHSDIFSDVVRRRSRGETQVFTRIHAPVLASSGIGASILVLWVEQPESFDASFRLLQLAGAARREIRESEDSVRLILSGSDLAEAEQAGQFALLLGVEGLSGLQGDVDILDALYSMGVRHASLTWNECNAFAGGAGAACGLGASGIPALARMEELGMIVDVSHASELSFWDILNATTRPLIASHSNAAALCPSRRNLTDEQILALDRRGGVIGLNAWPDFVDPAQSSAERLAVHADHIAILTGHVDCIGLGFDFIDYLGAEDKKGLFSGPERSTEGLENAQAVPSFLSLLSRRGYTRNEIELIAHGNMERIVRGILR